MTFWEWYDRNLLAAKQYDVAVYELEWLILHQTSIDKMELRMRSPQVAIKISSKLLSNLDKLWQKRLHDRIPVQYLTGRVAWRNLELKVSPAVLIPRPETELIVDIVIDIMSSFYQDITNSERILVDLGTGSGAIAIALAQHFLDAKSIVKVHAIDCSHKALEIAKINAVKNLQQQKIDFHYGYWFEPLASLNLQEKILGVISNPPYIPSIEVLNLQPEVCNHEPHLALDGGTDGLDDIRELVNTAPLYLISGGFWIIEMMAGQAEVVRSLLDENGKYKNIQVHKDYAGIERFISAAKR